MLLLGSLLLTGCWKTYDELNVIDFSDVSYKNPLVDAPTRVRMFDLDLFCPDGEPARLFAVYGEDQDEAGPAAIVLHSGAFDYVVDPEEDGDVLAGEHYHLDSRLTRAWGNDKVWETLGVHRYEIEPPEENLGTLPAALADAGFIQLYPANCWGDLWHGESGGQQGEPDFDGFDRNGLGFAWQTVRMLTEPEFGVDKGFEVPVTWTGELYLIGLGMGGRGVAELLLHEDMVDVSGILVDSSPDDLTPYVENPVLWEDEVEGLERIFGFEQVSIGDLDDWSLLEASAQKLLPDRVGYLWSDLDPRVPDEAMEPFAELHADIKGYWIENTGRQRHVFTNAEEDTAYAAVDYLLTGTVPADTEPDK